MSIIDKIQESDYVYSTFTKWGLKRFICDVSYFTEEPLDDLSFVVCSVLDNNEGLLSKKSLGIILGFSLMTNTDTSKDLPLMYYDVAELRLFENLLAKVESERLISISEESVVLTKLGKISLERNLHYRFFKGKQNVFEHLKLKTKIEVNRFPFYDDMGIYSSVSDVKQIWPEDDDVYDIIDGLKSELVERVLFNSKNKLNYYSATICEYYDFENVSIEVRLYNNNGTNIPVIVNQDSVAMLATEYVNDSDNALLNENLVLECLFQKLWDDKTAILNYYSLQNYLELVDYRELTNDPRTEWCDDILFKIIIDNADQTCWRNITRNCDVEVLYKNIESISENIIWKIFSERVSDDFLIDHFHEYPWDLEVISGDMSRRIETIESLILQKKQTNEDWNWSELQVRLTESFVLAHLDLVDINLKDFTKNSEQEKQAIVTYPDKRWDWIKVEKEFDLSFIYDNITVISDHLQFVHLFERILLDDTWSMRFVTNGSFVDSLKKAIAGKRYISKQTLNDKNYIWQPEVIDVMTEIGLLDWATTPYMKGFECNTSLVWNKSFFSKYSKQIKTKDGFSYVSSQIKDYSILKENPDWNWDWSVLSENEILLSVKSLYSDFGAKLNWNIVLDNQQDIEFLQQIDNIDQYIGEDESAWKKFSEIATIEYVIEKFKKSNYPWNWTVLTERLFPKLKLENLGNKLFVDNWDWNYLSDKIDIEFLSNNLQKFSSYWNWDIVFGRLLTSDNRFDFSFLDEIAYVLSEIENNDIKRNAWLALTKQYRFKELKKIIHDTIRRKGYWWDMSYFCNHKEFDVFIDLESCRSLVDWDVLSSSQNVDERLMFNPKLKIKHNAWTEEVKKLIFDPNNKWNFKLLSSFKSLRDSFWFVAKYKDSVDWKVISQFSNLFCEIDKEKLNKFIESFKSYIDFGILSEREDVDIRQIIKICPKANYDFNSLIKRGTIDASVKLVEENPNYNWDWYELSSKSTFLPNASFLMNKIRENFNWTYLSSQDNQGAWSDSYLIFTIAKDGKICDLVNWRTLSSLRYFPVNKHVFSVLPLDKLDWKSLSSRKNMPEILDEYVEYVDWYVFSSSNFINLSNVNFLDRYKDYLDWGIICRRSDFVFTNDILIKFEDYIDWNVASSSLTIQFSKQFVEQFIDKWNWAVLVKNKAFYNNVDKNDFQAAKQENIVRFINHFPYKPKAYHFTHFDNAIKIIHAMKLQSRNYAEGKFSNSAGSNVTRTDKAHKFARFYFVPKSPTQFYNECLGKDQDDTYYLKALNLGLPKCPMPVFFVFDIEELLMKMPDKCFYSNGNMQKDSSQSFKVIDDPDRIRAKEIFINSKDTFNERQQEFLVEGELDFSKLNDVQICCYDSYQAQKLRDEMAGTKWGNIIFENRSLYVHKNKELYFDENEETISISTDYNLPYELRVTYTGNESPVIINSDDVVRQRGNDIYLNGCLNVSKKTSFEVYFEVSYPRQGSWLIYKNK